MPFHLEKLEIEDVLIVNYSKHEDERGSFAEIFRNTIFSDLNLTNNFVQDNLVYSKKDVLRGIHYQEEPHSQSKLINVIKGEIFDVALDIRPQSKTYGFYVSKLINDKDCQLLYVPEGFAHGYLVLSEFAIVSYKTNREYNPESEKGIIWNDSHFNINWPTANPILSENDKNWGNFTPVK